MAEYIEREAAIAEVEEWYDMYPDSDASREALSLTKRAIQKLPAADVRPVVRGKWEVFDADFNSYSCSACGEPFTLNDGTPEENNMNFCPNCGARMDGGEP